MSVAMASDASRRWLDDSGIWSCRIKLPQSHSQFQSHAHAKAKAKAQAQAQAAQAKNARAVAENAARSQQHHHNHHTLALDMTSTTDTRSMDVPLQSTSTSPNAHRSNEGDYADENAVQMPSMPSLRHLPSDPDAQATVTDFLDFTEYLPSDMIRSLTLIGNLDQQYSDASLEVHDLTKLYGQLPSLPADNKPDPTALRSAISQNLSEAVGIRTASYAEACRMLENVQRHYNRIKNIHAKLQSIAETYPDSRDPSPVPTKNRSPTVNRPPKITLRVGGGGGGGGATPAAAADSGANKIRKHRPPRITVPGEVLAPYELDYESWDSETDESSDDQFVTPRETPSRTLAGNKIRLKVPKQRKDRAPKPPRDNNRPPGFGTNVHSMIAGISTSNALKLLQPPPPDAKPGSEHLPWLALSEYELGHLRKKMKKNAVWSPSDTMINRELKVRGRGLEAYRAAAAEAAARGETIGVPPQLSGQNVTDKGALSAEAANKSLEDEAPLMNRGMKLNEAKKLKRENQKKELEAAEDGFEEAMRKVENAKATIESLFSNGDKSPVKEDKKSTAKTPSRTPARKRKRGPETDGEGDAEKATGAGSARLVRPLLKRNKTETPVPVPQSIAAKQATPASEATPSVVSETTVQVATPAAATEAPAEASAAALPIPVPSPKKSITPILPPVRASKKNVRSELRKIETPTATSERPHRGVAATTPATPAAPVTVPLPIPPPVSTPTPTATAPETLPAKRPTSSRSKAASVERELATAATDRPRRSSTARNTPAPEPQRQPSKRTKRPVPGVVTKNSEDSTAVSVGKRSAATRKKAGPKKEKKDGREGSAAAQEIYDEIDDEGNLIDPDEPRYCLCNRVSFGTMIGCENHDCEKEWFHLECVGLTEIPPRTTKWYCPECRITLRIGEKGEVNARGKKK